MHGTIKSDVTSNTKVGKTLQEEGTNTKTNEKLLDQATKRMLRSLSTHNFSLLQTVCKIRTKSKKVKVGKIGMIAQSGRASGRETQKVGGLNPSCPTANFCSQTTGKWSNKNLKAFST